MRESSTYSGNQAPEPRLESTAPGSIKARMKIYQYNVNTTSYTDSLNALVQALVDVAANSNGLMDPDSIIVESTGNAD